MNPGIIFGSKASNCIRGSKWRFWPGSLKKVEPTRTLPPRSKRYLSHAEPRRAQRERGGRALHRRQPFTKRWLAGGTSLRSIAATNELRTGSLIPSHITEGRVPSPGASIADRQFIAAKHPFRRGSVLRVRQESAVKDRSIGGAPWTPPGEGTRRTEGWFGFRGSSISRVPVLGSVGLRRYRGRCRWRCLPGW